ncbi:MAG: hypothetical protein GY861_19680 [bacterium]|nr:hypothetical protein [bacterium]
MGVKVKDKVKQPKSGLYDTVTQVAGEDAVPIIKFLKNKKNISEFKIAEKTNQEVNLVRNMLYRLQNQNLVTYYRKKDRQKGWYISYWSFNPKGLKHYVSVEKKHRLEELKERLKREEEYEGQFYICPRVCTRMDFDTAAEMSFKCPECGNTLAQQDNAKTITRLKEKISSIQVA